jgi:hypothetical protein
MEGLVADDLQTEPWLHIYAQYTNHAPATIRGTKEGLIALRDALTAAIDNGKGEGTAYTSDGEGYPIEVQRVNVLNFLGRLPYTADLNRWQFPPNLKHVSS